MSPDERLDRLEAAVALLLARDGHVQVAEYVELRKEVRRAAPGLVTEAAERRRQRQRDQPHCLFTGVNADVVAELVGDLASMRLEQNSGVWWLVGDAVDGQSRALRPGSLIEIESDPTAIHVIDLDPDYDISDLYREAGAYAS